jgi:hypothetical protein
MGVLAASASGQIWAPKANMERLVTFSIEVPR